MKIRARRVISSKLKSAAEGRKVKSGPKISLGMQYTHRKLQRSVTEIRRSRSGRLRRSTIVRVSDICSSARIGRFKRLLDNPTYLLGFESIPTQQAQIAPDHTRARSAATALTARAHHALTSSFTPSASSSSSAYQPACTEPA